ncbi:GTP-binding protein Rho1 [Serendipita sp. 411]|nr:GTP-binding protein Rho1 [Serendipita sp. 401]KAG8838852.1 GTP-binding protein Rho1 [Serendipita sp. 411]KAG9021485.1 GTP-binding protein Rho1 [Serendipita sp. 407]
MDVRLDELEKWEKQKGIERNSNSSAIISETTTKRAGNAVPALTTDEESEILELAIWDTSSHDEEVHTRIFAYSHTEVFALCVAVNNPTSLDHALNKVSTTTIHIIIYVHLPLSTNEQWAPEILHYAPHARFVLIGLKSDLYYGQKASQDACDLWKRDQGSEIARRLEVDPEIGYMDCSAYTYDHVPDVLLAIAHVGLKAKRVKEKQRGGCIIV